MNFAQLRFWVLLGTGLIIIAVVRQIRQRWRPANLAQFDRLSLLILGWSMLLAVSRVTFFIFLAVKLSGYWGLKLIVTRARGRRRYLALLIPLVMLPLFYYKYSRFIGQEVLGLHWETWQDVVIPVGISFYTFQAVAFLVDTLAFHEPLPRFLDFMNFAGFFPQIVAGPIERRHNLMPQMERFRWRWDPAAIDAGVSWIAVGLFLKMCLADNLATYFDANSTTNPFLIWIANITFGLRIYYDFAGYSLVALGLARCLGVKLTLNFASPYCSRNITEFWRRWHITLSQWFRDYVYIPLGGSRTQRWPFNVLVVFVVSGAWHGAGWNFLLWGVFHGVFLILHRLTSPWLKLPRLAAWFLTMVGTFAAWLCFYEANTVKLISKLKTLALPSGYTTVSWHEMLSIYWNPNGFVLLCFIVMSALTILLEWRSLASNNEEPFILLRRPSILLMLVLLTVALAPANNNAFIYFAF